MEWQGGSIPALSSTDQNHKGWNVEGESFTFMNKVKQSGLWPLVEYNFMTLNSPIITAMVERWHLKTNSFYFPFGEMTITLNDVTQIVGIPVMGKAIYGSTSMDIDEAAELVKECLNLSMTEIREELRLHNGCALKLKWLRGKLANKSSLLPEQHIDFVVRGYLLFVLGCTIFSDKTGSTVPTSYLRYLVDVQNTHTFGWEAVALAHLYRQLGIASRANCKQISGYGCTSIFLSSVLHQVLHTLTRVLELIDGYDVVIFQGCRRIQLR
ncbi:hypothetical protein QJS04_geneDACA023077 [Acorus gramineus]|uniref:Aminotransferase-like plant mobile domain-containing protein n=1 Tax=Acorus gramineus TaxID=55184 RepID=A0AAV9BPT4_ACOGR|nr:hypothetical protein QJS04_geneDACA023077 [Acorus gramineus]